NHNLFSVSQFCDADLEVAFRKSTCYISDLKGNDLLIGMKFLNKTLHAYFASEWILHQTDGENLDKMKEKGDACIFVRYSTQSRAYRVFNKRTRVIVETIHVNFDELPQMASDHVSSDPGLECQRMALEHDSLSPGLQCQDNVPQADKLVTTSNELDLLFSLMFDELLNGSSKVVSKSSAASTANAPNQRQQHTTQLNTHTTPAHTCQVPPLEPTVASTENMNQAEMIEENVQVENDEFINIFYGLVDPYHPGKVYRLKKALYGLKQALRAWYDENSNFLESKGFTKGSIDPTLVITKHRGDILLVQIYVDDIIFGSTNPNLSKRFEKIMHNKFEMSMMGELKFFFGIQIHQSPRAKLTEKHLTAFKLIFRYLKDTIHIGLWYPKYTSFELTAFSDSDYAGCLDSRKSTSGGIQFLGGDKLVNRSSKKQDCTSMSSAEVEYVSLSMCCA
nr:Gag-Pol polyprotein [Tanacetum cinerariifolium]